MGHVERYQVLHPVARTQEVRRPGDYELQCTRCRKSAQRSLDNVVLEHTGGEYAPLPPTGERIPTSGKQVLENSTAHGIEIMEALEGILGSTEGAQDRKILEMVSETMADSEPTWSSP
jgi:hypothetical protein